MTANQPSGNRVKGVVFRNFVQVTTRIGGAEAWAKVAAALEPEVAEAHRHGAIVSGGWYPVAWYCAFHRAAEKAGIQAAPSFAWAMGRESTRMDLSGGIYHLLLRVVSPAFLISKAPLLFNSYYQQGSMVVSGTTSTHTRAEWKGCAGFSAHVWQDVVGGCEGALEAAGAKGVALRVVHGGRDGDERTVADADWT